MDENARVAEPLGRRAVMREALIASALEIARGAPRSSAWPRDRIILSCKVSGVQDLIARLPRARARAATIALHLGLTEAGMGTQGHRRLDRGDGACCCRKASATRSASRSRPSRAATRTQEVIVAQEILQTHGPARVHADGDRLPGLRPHDEHRTSRSSPSRSRRYLRAQMPVWRERYPGVEDDARRGDGLRRQRPGRIEARRHRHQPARAPAKRRSRRSSSTAQKTRDAARASASPRSSRRIVEDYVRATLRRRSQRPRRHPAHGRLPSRRSPIHDARRWQPHCRPCAA